MVVVINTFAITANAMAISAAAITMAATNAIVNADTAAAADTNADTISRAYANSDTISVAYANSDTIAVAYANSDNTIVADADAISKAAIEIIAAANTINITEAYGFCKSAPNCLTTSFANASRLREGACAPYRQSRISTKCPAIAAAAAMAGDTRWVRPLKP